MIDKLLDRLENVTKGYQGGFRSKCPCCGGNSRNKLSIREVEDTVLIKCFAGCGAADVLDSVGLTFSDLYPKTEYSKPVKVKMFSAGEALTLLAHEVEIIGIYSRSIESGYTLDEDNMQTLKRAIDRVKIVYTEMDLYQDVNKVRAKAA